MTWRLDVTTNIFDGLVFRTAIPYWSQCGMIYACDPRRERRQEPHAYVFLWDKGQIERGDCNYDAHSVCRIAKPGDGTVDVSEAGYYTADADSARVTQDIFASSAPKPKERRARGIRSVHEIAGVAHAIGFRGMVYRLDAIGLWTRIDDGLPSEFDGEALHGFGLNDVYAVGARGNVWHFDGKSWDRQDIPTNGPLNAVKCTPDGTVYIAGANGTLLRGRRDEWSMVGHGDMADDIWDIEHFAGQLFLSTLDGVFTLEGDHLRRVNFGRYTPRTTYQLSAVDDVLWSNGERDVMEFDGKRWTRII